MINVTKIVNTCTACPSQWSGVTDDEKEVYVRYRWGYLSVDVGEDCVFEANPGDSLDGYMDFDELKEHTKNVISWPVKESKRE